MSKLIPFFITLFSFVTIINSEAPRSNGYHIDRPNLSFTLPVKSSFRTANSKLRFSLPLRDYGPPIQQTPPAPSFGNPSFARPTSNGIDLGLQLPETTNRPEYSEENQNSVETFEENQNGGAELGRLTNAPSRNKFKSAKQQVEQQPKVTFQFQVPQFQNGFAHALAVYNPSAEQPQLVSQYQTEAPAAVVTQQQLIGQYPLTAAPIIAQYQVSPTQQQVFGNLPTQAIFQPQSHQYVQVQPTVQLAQQVQPAIQLAQPVQPAFQLAPAVQAIPSTYQIAQPQPAPQVIAGRLPSGEPFARATTGKLQAQPIQNQQYQILNQQFQPAYLGQTQNAQAHQIAQIPVQQQLQQQQQQVDSQAQNWAYTAIGF